MHFEPHELFIVRPGESFQLPDGGWSDGEPLKERIGGCFQHDVTTEERRGYSGIGLNPKKRIALDRRDDLKLHDQVEVYEKGVVIGQGNILDIKKTSGIRFAGLKEKMTIFI